MALSRVNVTFVLAIHLPYRHIASFQDRAPLPQEKVRIRASPLPSFLTLLLWTGAITRVPLIRLETLIRAPIEICFDLSRDIDLHMRSTAATHEIAVAGVISGLIGPGEQVTWEATHFHLRLRLTSRIVAFYRPHHFRGEQVRGPFRRLEHDHLFVAIDERSTRMWDELRFESPLRWVGRTVDQLVLEDYLRKLLIQRNASIKSAAESR